ncbi:MAG: ABC transporter permease, partial [Deltaproteobacteria bacterium]|nr:ABC transporter permease [Deltaproteobacteria bacterium]
LGASPEVELRNPEYELTRAIKKVMYRFKGGGNLFAALDKPLTLTAYISADAKLPGFLQDFKKQLLTLAGELKTSAAGKFQLQVLDPEADGGAVARKIATDFGFRPMQAGLLDPARFYFYLTLGNGEQTVQVGLPDDFSKIGLRQNLEAGVKRFADNYLKTVGLAVPQQPANPSMAQYGMVPEKRFNALRQQLETNYKVQDIDLNRGTVPEDVDILLIAAVKNLDKKGLFAVDQFLMKGGTVLVAASAYDVQIGRDKLTATVQQGKLQQWLAQQGLQLEKRLVLDPRNQPFPVPATRNVGGFILREVRLVPYPYFIDVREQGLNQKLPITSNLSHVMLNWASPIQVDSEKTKGLKQRWLLKSSPRAWTSDSLDLIPRVDQPGAPQQPPGEQLLGVMLQGRFSSSFTGKGSPLLAENKSAAQQPKDKPEQPPQLAEVIDKSPESARLILLSSADFLSDQTLQLASSTSGQQDLGALQLVENTIDWSLEDAGLLSIRSRGHYARTLIPLDRDSQKFYEYLNYLLV